LGGGDTTDILINMGIPFAFESIGITQKTWMDYKNKDVIIKALKQKAPALQGTDNVVIDKAVSDLLTNLEGQPPLETAEGRLGEDLGIVRLMEEGATRQKLLDRIHKAKLRFSRGAVKGAAAEELPIETAEGTIGTVQPTILKEGRFEKIENLPAVPTSQWREENVTPQTQEGKPITERIIEDIRSLIDYSKTPQGLQEQERIANVIADLDARYEKIKDAQNLDPKQLHKVAEQENVPKGLSKTETVKRLNGIDIQELVNLEVGKWGKTKDVSQEEYDSIKQRRAKESGRLKGGRQAGGTILFTPQEWADLVKAGAYHLEM
jgi:hypothetical protein